MHTNNAKTNRELSTRQSQQQRQQRRDAVVAAFMEQFGRTEPWEDPSQMSSTTKQPQLQQLLIMPHLWLGKKKYLEEEDSAGAAVAEADIPAAAAGGNRRPNRRLAQIRQAFTATGVRKKSKAKSTFDGHQRNNERFILYLFENHLRYLKEDLSHELYDADADSDYSSVEATYHVYRRRGGKKSLDK